MKTKAYKAEVLDVADKGIVTIAISRFEVPDAVGDIAHKGAFTKTFKEGGNRIKHLLDHQLKYTGVVGLPVKMYENDTHAVVESALNMEKQVSRDLFSDYKFFQSHSKTLEHSYGYQTIKGRDIVKGKSEHIDELKMFEYSTVMMGMHPDTPLLGLKAGDVDVELLETYLRKFDVSNKRAKEIENIIKAIKELSLEPEITLDEVKSIYSLDISAKPSQLVIGGYKLDLTKL
jgi:hypothetical protein